MSLEEDVVIQRMNQGSDAKDMDSVIEELERIGLKVDKNKVNVAIERYELIQKYNSQDNGKRVIRKETEKQFGLIKKMLIERFMEDSSITGVKLKKLMGKYSCPICKKKELREYVIGYKKLKEVNNRFVSTDECVSECITFCFACGTYAPNQTSRGIQF